jgi:hypothetical protein
MLSKKGQMGFNSDVGHKDILSSTIRPRSEQFADRSHYDMSSQCNTWRVGRISGLQGWPLWGCIVVGIVLSWLHIRCWRVMHC